MIWCMATYGIINLLITHAYGFLEFGRDGTAEQSSTYPGYDAPKAIDGNKSQKLQDGSCIHTATYQLSAWWKLDLGKKVMVHNVVIYYREEYPDRLKGYYIYITDNFNPAKPNSGYLCYHDNEPGYLSLIQNRTCNFPGQNIVIYNRRTSGQAILELCEVEVYGCNIGFYGYNCDKNCSVNCVTNTCNVWNGSCTCKPGYTGDTCDQECPQGSYGYNCLGKCTNCSHSCHPENGKCYIIEGQQDNKGKKCNAQMWRNLAIAFIGLFIATLCTFVIAIVLYCRKTIHSKSDLPESKVQEEQKDVYDTVADVEMTDASKDFPKYTNYHGSMSNQISTVSDEVQQQSVYQELLETRDNSDHVYDK